MSEATPRGRDWGLFRRRLSVYVALAMAGGSIYFLPFLRQSYNNTMLKVLNISSTELGLLNSVFGIVAMATYLPSGWVADRYSPRILLSVSLLCTGVSGLFFATFPPYWVVVAIHAFWGVCTILTFWAALVKAMREFGDSDNQGRTFGGFASGRGVIEGAIASAGLFAFTSMAEGAAGLAAAIVVYSVVCLVAAAAVWFLTPDPPRRAPISPASSVQRRSEGGLRRVARMPVAWLIAGVVLAAYSASWGTYDIAAYAEDAFGLGAAASARLSAFRMWFRVVAPVLAGVLADRFRPSRVVSIGLAVVAASFVTFALVPSSAAFIWVLWLNTATAALALYALSGVYFALLQEGRVPSTVTGSVVGAVSLVGYTPDVWAPLLNGWLVDALPGGNGHRIYFLLLAAVSAVGIACARSLGRVQHGQSGEVSAMAETERRSAA